LQRSIQNSARLVHSGTMSRSACCAHLRGGGLWARSLTGTNHRGTQPGTYCVPQPEFGRADYAEIPYAGCSLQCPRVQAVSLTPVFSSAPAKRMRAFWTTSSRTKINDWLQFVAKMIISMSDLTVLSTNNVVLYAASRHICERWSALALALHLRIELQVSRLRCLNTM
jgi:hypothetical protein